MTLPLFNRANQPGRLWSVSELTAYIREMFEIDFRLQDVELEGEISNLTRARSGHLYFNLKDDQAQIRCVMWRSSAERLPFEPQEGDAVVAEGRVSVYESGGVYQLYAERMTPAGRGDLARAFEELKAGLDTEGLFAAEHKQPIPPFPHKIGIVTSADAAALRDILNVLRRRWPLVSVLIAPTLVQGVDAPPQIVRALGWLDGRFDVDTIIVARGGGSIEDLWAFNDERVVRAIFDARHPVIVGVGHEVDHTLADYVADLRAPTPSAAAELAVPDRAEMYPQVLALQAKLAALVDRYLAQQRDRVAALQRSVVHLGPVRRLSNDRQRLDMAMMRLDRALGRRLERYESRLALAAAQLTAVSPLATLARGYAIVRQADGRLVRRVADVAAGDRLQIQVTDGAFAATAGSPGLDKVVQEEGDVKT